MNAPAVLSNFSTAVEESVPVALAAGYGCGHCGLRFATKGEKKRHKLVCKDKSPLDSKAPDNTVSRNEDEYLYGRNVHITPEIKARADAEWAAMDELGRLPDGWTYEPPSPPRTIDQHIERGR